MTDKKKYLYVQVTEDLFEMVASLINQTGSSIHVLFENAILDHARVIEGKGKNKDPFITIMLAGREAQKYSMNLDHLRNVAYLYTANPSDEKLAALVEMCDSIGVDVDTILDETNKNENVVEYVKEHGQLSKAEQWLADNVPNDIGIEASTLREKSAKELGCSWETINRAKRALGIQSKKQGKSWIWHWPIQEEEATEEDLYIGEI